MEDTRTGANEAQTLADGASSPTADEPVERARGDLVGRYVVLGKLGAGGMGVVYAAYDPELDRKVALKLLLPSSREGSRGRARLLREAQALAKLSHPAIVAVHDVGTVGARVWIAMEFVAGTTLREWLAQRTRSWKEVLAVMTAAGRGLAAAHDAGLVHRDFKPDNVMVGDDHRVRVMDFGLARAVDEAPQPRDEHAQPRVAALSETLTRTGVMPGTPAYMAAEQLGGAAAGAKSDQFAFCVSTWEALFGERPFAGDTLVARAASMLEGRVRSTKSMRAPGWVRRAVRRGLARDPAMRWPSMVALLAELDRGQARVRLRRVVLGVSTLGLAGAGFAAAYQLDRRQRTAACEQAGASIDEVWNEDARVRLREALAATGASYAETTATKVMPSLDAQALALQQARTEACLDAHVRHEWSAETLERSSWCLDERLMEFEALLGELVRGDANVVQKAVTAAAGLASVDACRDAALLERLPRPPTEQHAEIRDVRVKLSRAGALESAGGYAEGLDLARSAREDADALGWPPLLAAALAREASLLSQLGDYDEAARVGAEAYYEAARIDAWDVATGAASELVFVVGYRLARHVEGLGWGRLAEVALAHAGDPEGLREASIVSRVATVHHETGDYAQAQRLNERALAIFEQALGPNHPRIADRLNNLARVHLATGEHAKARTMFERTLVIREQTLGPDHPDVAKSLNNLGSVHYETGEYAKARTLHERALAIGEKALGPDHPDVAASLTHLGNVHRAIGDHARARALHERALAIREKALGPDHLDVAASLTNLASVHRATREYAQARTLYERALAIREKALGPDHPDVAKSLNNLAVVHQATGKLAQARALLERALEVLEKALGPTHPDVAQSLFGLANVQIANREVHGAVRLLERTIAIYDQHDGIQEAELGARFALAQALVTIGGDRARARVLAEQARDGWHAAGAGKATQLAEVQQWLRRVDSRAMDAEKK